MRAVLLVRPSHRAAAAAALAAALWVVALRPGAADGQTGGWFSGDLREARLTAMELEALADAAWAAAAGRALPELPERIRRDAEQRIVFVSVSDGQSAARVAMGAGKGFSAALASAAAAVRRRMPAESRPAWVKLDVVSQARRFDPVGGDESLRLDRSLWGLALDREAQAAFLPEELVAKAVIDNKGAACPEALTACLERSQAAKHPAQWAEDALKRAGWRFSTSAVFTDGRKLTHLYRGNPQFVELSAESLLTAARNAGEYLIRSVAKDGKFAYSYYPKSGKEAQSYNMLRHAGTVWAMLQLYKTTLTPELRRAAERAIGYLLGSVKPAPGDARAAVVVEAGEVKLGGNALALLALAEHAELTGDRRHLGVMRQLARWMIGVQAAGGRFAVHKMSYPAGEPHLLVSAYYPGEAIFALARLYGIDPQEEYLDAAEKNALFLINTRDGRVLPGKLPHDHWLCYGLDELYRRRKKPVFLEHVDRISRAIVQAQVRDGAPHPDWYGCFLGRPRSSWATTRTEALCAAWRLARDFGKPLQPEMLAQAVRAGTRFSLRTQFVPPSAMYVQDPPRCLGGFRESLTNYEVRIDYVQHSIAAILGCLAVVQAAPPNGPGRPAPR